MSNVGHNHNDASRDEDPSVSEAETTAPSMHDVSLDDKVCSTQSYDYDTPSDCETCCNEAQTKSGRSGLRNLCTWLTILIAILSLTGMVLAAIPSTDHLALVIFLPMVTVAVLVCSILSCCIACANNNKVIIEPSNLPPPPPKDEQAKGTEDIEVKGEDTAATVLTDNAIDLESTDKPFLARALPDIYEFIHETQQSFDETATNIYNRLFRPAALCRPETPIRCRSTGTICKTDIERANDIANLRDEYGAINLTGTYKLVQNDNFDGFLKALNISAILRKAANAARPTHKYTHDGESFRVQIEGIIKGDTTFTLGGPPTTSFLRGHEFLDYPTYLEDKKGVQVRKVLQNQSKNNKWTTAEIIVSRELSRSGKKMIMKSRALDYDGNEVAKAVQIFHRV